MFLCVNMCVDKFIEYFHSVGCLLTRVNASGDLFYYLMDNLT